MNLGACNFFSLGNNLPVFVDLVAFVPRIDQIVGNRLRVGVVPKVADGVIEPDEEAALR